MRVHDKTEYTDAGLGINHANRTKHRLLAKRADHVTDDAEARQNQYVYLGMRFGRSRAPAQGMALRPDRPNVDHIIILKCRNETSHARIGATALTACGVARRSIESHGPPGAFGNFDTGNAQNRSKAA
jgi:hypothetical protein